MGVPSYCPLVDILRAVSCCLPPSCWLRCIKIDIFNSISSFFSKCIRWLGVIGTAWKIFAISFVKRSQIKQHQFKYKVLLICYTIRSPTLSNYPMINALPNDGPWCDNCLTFLIPWWLYNNDIIYSTYPGHDCLTTTLQNQWSYTSTATRIRRSLITK